MKINIIEKIDKKIKEDEIVIEIHSSDRKQDLNEFIKYLNDYELKHNNSVVVMNEDYTLLEIKYKDIIVIYSDKKYNYCRTKDGTYRIKSKLYEIEKMDESLVRISKSCIINIKHINKFDISEVGKIVINLDDGSKEIVSRRKTKPIMKYLKERMIWLWKKEN